ncbi:MAG TPA: hypothetical protein VJQ51_00955 [Burkholderiales bacterium]|nr:hypothetical protein [Burkholderiales bacterium]
MAQAASRHENKCGHAACRCTVKPGEHFCSEYCAKASPAQISGTLPGERHSGDKCGCGHPACN